MVAVPEFASQKDGMGECQLVVRVSVIFLSLQWLCQVWFGLVYV